MWSMRCQGFHPTPKLSFSLTGTYTDNLSGSLYQALVPGASGSSLAACRRHGSLTRIKLPPPAEPDWWGCSRPPARNRHMLRISWPTPPMPLPPICKPRASSSAASRASWARDYGSNLYDAEASSTPARSPAAISGQPVSVFDSTVDGSSQNQLGFSVNANYGRRIRRVASSRLR